MTETIATQRSRHGRRGLVTSCAVAAVLALSGCDRDETTEVVEETTGDGAAGAATSYHEGDWVDLEELDPHGEGCANCHDDADMGAFGGDGHNLGLQYDDTAEDLGVEELEITSVSVDEDEGELEIEVNENLSDLADDRDVRFTFAKLAPRTRHDRGHDWQNYLNEVRDNADDDGATIAYTPRPQPADRDEAMEWDGNGQTFTIDMSAMDNGADGVQYDWGEHEFDVTDVDGDEHGFDVTGTRTEVPDLSDHVQCADANDDAHQIESEDGAKLTCWWPDGTSLPSGTFVSDDDEFIVAYEAGYTHRVGLQIDGNPGHNVVYDFVPDTDAAEGDLEHVNVNGGVVQSDQYDVTDVDQNEPAARDVVDTASCNSCHDQLAAHGSNRSSVDMCVTCHNPGNLESESGRSADLKQLAHRIHRGSNLPSVEEGFSVSYRGGDWSSVNFPQGPSPGSDAGVTNCVKCHMGDDPEGGEASRQKIAELAEELGPGNGIDDLDALQLAEPTPQGDNWTDVRSVEACQACHDDNVWYTEQGDDFDETNALDRFYRDEDYLGDSDSWRSEHQGGVDLAAGTEGGAGGFYGCGSGGGCHDTPGDFGDDAWTADDLGANQLSGFSSTVPDSHLQLIRDSLIADRFEIVVDEASVDQDGFTATVALEDTQGDAQTRLEDGDDLTGLGELGLDLSVFFGWMGDGSPDYTHSTGDDRQPGSPTDSVALTSVAPNGDGSYTVDLSWDEIGRTDWSDFDDPSESVGTVVVEGDINLDDEGTVSIRSAAEDFAFDADGDLLEKGADGDARRMLVDFMRDDGPNEGGVQSCRSCHMQLSQHGGNRTNNPQVCIVCHNPNMTDVARAERMHNADTGFGGDHGNPLKWKALGEFDDQFEESEDFKRLIHAVHASGREDASGTAGDDRFRIDAIQARGNHRTDTNFPGVLSNCNSCHIEETFVLDDLPDGMIGSTALTGDWWGEHRNLSEADIHDLDTHRKMTPIASVCTSCHDSAALQRENEDASGGDGRVGWHIWAQDGRAPGVAEPGSPSDLNLNNLIRQQAD